MSAILESSVEIDGEELALPRLSAAGPPGSLTDFRPQGGTEILIFGIREGGGFLDVSRSGAHVEVGRLRELVSLDKVNEATIAPGGEYRRLVRVRLGALIRTGMLILKVVGED